MRLALIEVGLKHGQAAIIGAIFPRLAHGTMNFLLRPAPADNLAPQRKLANGKLGDSAP